MPPEAAYSVAYVLGIASSYAINVIFVFQARGSLKTALKFPLVYAIQYVVGLAILSSLTHYGVDSRLAMLLVIAVSVPLTFLLTRFVLRYSA
jgi:putative flippase GtrA